MTGVACRRVEYASMFTQCSKCETIFRLSAESLRTAGGQVRCGRCGEIFNALARLTENASALSSGESPLELETRVDRILHSEPEPAASGEPDNLEELEHSGPQHAVLQWQTPDAPTIPDKPSGAGEAAVESEEMSMEFTLPPGELDRIFVISKPGSRKPFNFKAGVNPETQSRPEQVPRLEVVVQPTLSAAPAPLAHPETTAHPELNVHPERRARPIDAPAKTPQRAPEPVARATGFEVAENIRREVLEGVTLARSSAAKKSAKAMHSEPRSGARDRGIMSAWILAAVVLVLLLVAQLVHQKRAYLAGSDSFGDALRTVYSEFGATLPPPAHLAAYQLRQWGVTGDPSNNSTLRVRASILNTASKFQPYPLLRVSLANRFGGLLGTRNFEAHEYLGKKTAPLLAPGERVDAVLDILDPGQNAEGFEVDVCLRGFDEIISCANDVSSK